MELAEAITNALVRRNVPLTETQVRDILGRIPDPPGSEALAYLDTLRLPPSKRSS